MSQGHAVVDGSNIATEGRSTPSLAQLDEAVTTFIEQNDFEFVTVIVDATFEHRVEDPEREAAKSAIEGGEIFTPPAGVIGRGDAFILQVADKANAVVLSNDSFQEFHGTYDWLFDDGRLIGGKPIPGIGWIFVPRSPVRGPVSRRAMRQSTAMEPAPANPKIGDFRRIAKTTKTAKVTKAAKAAKKAPAKTTSAKKTVGKPPVAAKRKTAKKSTDANSDSAWRSFRSDYPEGSTVAAKVERFSSHGAYGSVDGVNVYIPLSLLGDPAPRRARDVISLGETVDFVVHGFDEARRSIDVGMMAFAGSTASAAAPKRAPARKPIARKAVAKKAAAKRPVVKKAAAKKTTAAKKAVEKKAVAKRAADKTPTAKQAAAKKAVAKRSATKTTVAKKTTTRKPAAKRPATKKAMAKRPAAQKADAKKTTTRKPAAKRPRARKPTAK